MGRKLQQIKLLVKKNFLILLPRKIGVLIELLLPFAILFGISFIRNVMESSSSCIGSYRPIDPLTEIWDDKEDRNMIGFAPNTDLVKNLGEKMLELQNYKLHSYDSTEVQIEILMEDTYNEQIIDLQSRKSEKFIVIVPTEEIFADILESSSGYFKAGLVFNETGDEIKYTMRFHQSDSYDSWYTELLYSAYDTVAWTGKELSGPYTYTGWLQLQQLVESSIMLVKGVTYLPSMVIRSTPTPSYETDPFVTYIQPTMIPLVLMISAMVMASSIATDIVEEKCSKMREVMRMMGLSDSTMWAGWFIQRSAFILFLSATITIVLKYMGYYNNSDGFLVFVFIAEFYSSLVIFFFFLTSLQRSIKVASFFMCVLTYLSYLPYDMTKSKLHAMSRGVKALICIFPLSGVNMGVSVISHWEDIEIGAQWQNLNSGPSSISSFSLGDVMGMMLLDMVLYGVLCWYVENVFPGEFGVPNKPWFMFTKDYWAGANSQSTNYGTMEKEPYEDATCHEKIPADLAPGIIIRNLTKTFNTRTGPKAAVDKLSMEMFEGQITALLGHNGAGKTTTINMLTGMYPPTSGDAVVDGYSILTNMNFVRQSMGICPQHNILFKMMTVQQHLDFFIRLKGVVDEKEIEQGIDEMLKNLNLEDKKNIVASKLSGGMKRKLSVGIALCGGSKIVMLDEPTTGMDASARRELWDMLLNNKEGRTIIFTTHSMDEADLLGDRIAIMANGKLVCTGSSLFLKRRYGVGYHLTLVKDPNLSEAGVDNITHFIQSHVPSATCNSNVGSELSFLLSADDISHFVGLFQKLETENEQYGISSFGVSLTTMEEVFMKAGEGHDSNVGAIKNADEKQSRKIRKFDHSEMNTGASLMLQQFMCQFKKRYIQAKRSKIVLFAQIALPIFFMIIGLSTYTGLSEVAVGIPRVATLADYPSQKVNAQLSFADLRNDGGGATGKIFSYLRNTLSVTVVDVSDKVAGMRYSYGNNTDACCTNPYLQLSTQCIEDLMPTKFAACYEDKYEDDKFTYKDCRDDCMSCTPGAECEGCSVRLPVVEDVEDEVNYYQNYLMSLAANASGDFYVDVQGGITLTDRSPLYRMYNENNEIVYETDSSVDNTAMFSDSDTEDILTSWVSFEGLHLIPAFQSAMTNLIFVMNDMDTRIQVTNEPLPESLEESSVAEAEQSDMVLISFYIFGVSFLVASFVVAPVEERVGKSKHLQQISGVNSIIYWLGMFCWDYINYLASMILVFIAVMAFNVPGFQGERSGALLLIILLEGIAVLPMVYILSHLFSKATSAYGVVTTFMFLLAMIGYVLYSVVYGLYEMQQRTLSSGDKNSYDWVNTFDLIMLFNPHYAAASAIGLLLTGYTKQEAYNTCLESYPALICAAYKPPAMLEISPRGTSIGRHLVALVVVGPICMMLLIMMELWWYRVRALLARLPYCSICVSLCKTRLINQPAETEDERVKTERERVYNEKDQLIETHGAVMINLHKQFGKKVAVQNLTMAINKGECFGLLGVNGAGKTTTFNMMTGDIAPTSGEGYLYTYNVVKQLRQAQKFIGYCPQFDALIGTMTGREILTMFANLRGVPQRYTEESVEEVVKMFNLEDHADKECGTYSGGNKRKLSTGIAIIGSPPLIFLDEPTSGMDPTARRFLWDVLCYLRSEGCSIVLTSHSMEECEALCTRLVIMVNGSNRCLGSIQQLKTTYSQGYTVCLLMEGDRQTDCQNFVDKTFPGAVLKECHLGYLMYSLGTTYKWSHIFNMMETNKGELGLLDYSVSQTSLEQVFLTFAKEQLPEKEKKSFTKKLTAKCSPCCMKKTVEPEADEIHMTERASFKRAISMRNNNIEPSNEYDV